MPSSINKLRKIGKFAVLSWHSRKRMVLFCLLFTAIHSPQKDKWELIWQISSGAKRHIFQTKLPPFIKSHGVFYFSNSISLLSGMETIDCKWYICMYTLLPINAAIDSQALTVCTETTYRCIIYCSNRCNCCVLQSLHCHWIFGTKELTVTLKALHGHCIQLELKWDSKVNSYSKMNSTCSFESDWNMK